MCPTCRTRTFVPPQGLPTNFSLQEMVSVMISKEDMGVYPCSNCGKKFDKSETWICHGCSNVVLCAVCSLKNHKGHHLQEISDVLSVRQKEINVWKAKVRTIKHAKLFAIILRLPYLNKWIIFPTECYNLITPLGSVFETHCVRDRAQFPTHF